MKPKSPSRLSGPYTSFPYLPLYLAELRYMIALSKEKGFNCSISDDEHEYEDLDDLVAHCATRIHKLTLKFSKEAAPLSDVRVIVKSSTVILTSDSGDEYVALEQRLHTYLKKRVPWFALLMNSWIWLILLGPLISFASGKWDHTVSTVLASILCVDVVMVFISLVVPHFFGGVHLQKKDEVVGFFSKYEKLIIAIVSAAIGAVGKWLLDHNGLGPN